MLIASLLFFYIVIFLRLIKVRKNSNFKSARNDKSVSSDFKKHDQKIKSAKVVLPVIFARTLSYEPGELGDNDKTEKIHYSEKALQDPEFLESVMRAPFTTGSHDKNTDESNRDIDGWPINAWYDKEKKGVFVEGYILGEKNIKYIKEKKGESRFGTSAYLDFLDLSKSENQDNTMQANKIHCNHLAILPNIRDEHNVIVAINAAKSAMNAINSKEVKKVDDKDKDIEDKNKDVEDVENDNVKELIKKLASQNSVVNERLDKIEKILKPLASNSDEDEDSDNEDDKDKIKSDNSKKSKKSKNSDDYSDEDKDDDKDTKYASNALPSEETIARVSNGLGVTFANKPTFSELANLLNVKEDSLADTISAVNSKCKEFEIKDSKSNIIKEGKNNQDASFQNLLKVL